MGLPGSYRRRSGGTPAPARLRVEVLASDRNGAKLRIIDGNHEHVRWVAQGMMIEVNE